MNTDDDSVPAETSGLLIESMIDHSPAAKAGLAVGDIVSHVNGEAVSRKDIERLRRMLEREGEVIQVTATREGQSMQVELSLRRLI